jgi:peptidoglycan/LPS O-acetylase OafA/YrhL
VIGIAALTYRYIEVPGRRYFNRLSERSMQERVVAPIEQPALP